MPLLTPILAIPLAAALLCSLVPWRRLMEWINILAFAATLALGIRLFPQVLPPHSVVTEWNEFFYADALSAWMVLLISAVSLATSLYAGRYFRRDLAAASRSSSCSRRYLPPACSWWCWRITWV
jgi:hydrogenase-4 component F